MDSFASRGILPVAPEDRRLGFRDFVVLWGDLGIGLLVLLAGSFLVPGLSLAAALLAILVGSVIGVALLAMTGLIGSRTGLPTMVCLRAALGRRGSYAATGLNVVQLFGWTVFELIVMGHAANAVGRRLLGVDAPRLWIVAFGVVVIGLTLWGPLGVVRQWLGRFAVWVMLLTSGWLTALLLARADLGALLAQPGTGALTFGTAVDIVVAMPISWLPLVCDYSRFARRAAPAAWGTAAGYLVANVWFYGLGALMLLTVHASREPKGFVEALALLAGPLVLLILLADETDEAWADLYSSAVSVQNLAPRAALRPLALGLGAGAILVALLFDLTRYEEFLLLTGSVFVPLFGVLATDYFLVRRGYDADALLDANGRDGVLPGVAWPGMVAWAVGVLAYLAIAGKLAGLGLAGFPALGASLPSLLAAALAHLGLSRAAAPGPDTAR